MNVTTLLHLVCDFHDIPAADVLAGKRTTLTAMARRQTIALAREFTCASLEDIASALQLQDFSSVHGALRRHREQLDHYPLYAHDFAALRAAVDQPEERP